MEDGKVAFTYDDLALLEYLVACYGVGAVPAAPSADEDIERAATLHEKLDMVLTAIEEADELSEEEE